MHSVSARTYFSFTLDSLGCIALGAAIADIADHKATQPTKPFEANEMTPSS